MDNCSVPTSALSIAFSTVAHSMLRLAKANGTSFVEEDEEPPQALKPALKMAIERIEV
jgi:hypothetical protein